MLKNGVLALVVAGALAASAAIPVDAQARDMANGSHNGHSGDHHGDRGNRGGGFFFGGPVFDFSVGPDCFGLYGPELERCRNHYGE